MFVASSAARIDAIRVGEFKVNNLHASPTLSADLMLIDSKSSQSLGRSVRNLWSEETMAALAKLMELMERDMAVDVFGTAPVGPQETLAEDAVATF